MTRGTISADRAKQGPPAPITMVYTVRSGDGTTVTITFINGQEVDVSKPEDFDQYAWPDGNPNAGGPSVLRP